MKDDKIIQKEAEKAKSKSVETASENRKLNEPKPMAPEPLDLSKLRLSQNFAETAGVKKVITNIPVRKPHRQEFVRVHPDPDYCFETAILEMKTDRELYIVDPSLWNELPGDILPMAIFTTVNRQGVLTLWPIRLPDSQGRHNPWHQSAFQAAEMAKKGWVKVAANKSLGGYEVFRASVALQDPEWPDLSFSEILNLAFKDKYITRLDHPVIMELRGER